MMPSLRRQNSNTSHSSHAPWRLAVHVCTVVVALALTFGIPFSRTAPAAQLLSGNTDAVSSATVALASPSGSFLVLINADQHPNAENLDTWEHFFAGEEIGFLFEDISVAVALGDATGLDMARSYQSRLPENQLTIRQEDPITLLSKAEWGRFDIIVMSREMADAYDAWTIAEEEGVIAIEATDSGAVVDDAADAAANADMAAATDSGDVVDDAGEGSAA